MRDKIIKILVNACIGVLTSVASLYLGASAVETVAASGTVTAIAGGRAAHAVLAVLA